MSGAAAVPVVWLTQGEAPEDARRALHEWARARGVSLVRASRQGPEPGLRVDLEVGDRVEEELERAHEAIAALDADAAEHALARAEGALRAHPELPQAAWLRAEVDRAWSTRWMRVEPRDEQRAREAARDAEALGGGRVMGIGETAFSPWPEAALTIVVHGGASGRVVLRVDGVPVTPASIGRDEARFEVSAAAAEHQITAALDGAPVFASWVAVSGAPSGGARPPVDVYIPEGHDCARAAFGGVSREDDRVRAAGVSCPRWIAAVPADRKGGVLVARCGRSTCGPLLEWRRLDLTRERPPQGALPRDGWPTWATWTLLGFGAATAAATALVATGAFEARPVEPRFIAGGVRVE